MRRFRRLFRHLPLRRDQLAAELDDEIASHIAARADQLESIGLSHEDALAEAQCRFGDDHEARDALLLSARRRAEVIRAHERGDLRRALTAGLAQDVRLGLRALRIHRVFAAATICTLGLAIAAAVTAFSFSNALFFRPLPAPAAERLVHVFLPRSDGRMMFVGRQGAALLRTRTDLFDRVAGEWCCWVKFVRERNTLNQRFAGFASAELFPMLGLTPRLGRFFLPSETSTRDREPVAIISYSLWVRAFGGDSRVLGERVGMAGSNFTIVGVAPEGFHGVGFGNAPSDYWFPSTMSNAVGIGCVPVVPCDDGDALARLAPGVSLARAEASLAGLAPELSRLAMGDDTVRTPVLMHASGALVGTQREFGSLARLLAAIAGVLLLIACANLSGLLVVRGVSRSREIALRRSLGADRLRVARQLLVESGIIAVAGGTLGVALSVFTARGLMNFFVSDSEGFTRNFEAGMDARVLWFALGISALSTLLFGLLPALLTSRAQPADVLKSGTGGGGRGRARFELVAVQVALTCALLTAAVLLSRSFGNLLHAQRFDVSDVALFRVRPAAAQYDTTRSAQYVRTVFERVKALPGVERVAFARGSGFVWSGSPASEHVGMSPADTAQRVETHFISPAFFAALRIPVLAGREFTDDDVPGTPAVAIVSASLARTLSPDADVLGRVVYARGTPLRIVGVVPDYQVHVLGEPVSPLLFVAFWQHALGPERDARFAVRFRNGTGLSAALATLQKTVHAIDPGVPVAEVMTLEHQMDASYQQIRLGQTVLLVSGGLALFLSAVGLYGMIAFLVTRRARDIGLRIALGSPPMRVAGMFVGRGMSAVTVGLVAGVAGAAALSQLLSAWLVGVSPHDVVAFALAAGSVLAVSAVACAIPARRAAQVDPTVALRTE